MTTVADQIIAAGIGKLYQNNPPAQRLKKALLILDNGLTPVSIHWPTCEKQLRHSEVGPT